MRPTGTLHDVVRLLGTVADAAIKWKFAIVLALVVAIGLLTALAPLALKALIDAVSTQVAAPRAALESVALFGVAYLVLIAGGRLLGEVRPLLYERAEQRLATVLSRRFFDHLLGLRLEFHLNRRTGALGQTISYAVLGCQLVANHVVNSIVPVTVELATVAVILLSLGQPMLVVAFMATAIVYLAIFYGSIVPITAAAGRVSDAHLDAHALLADSLLNCETIKCFNAEHETRVRYASATASVEAEWDRLNRQRFRIGLAVAVTFTVSMAMSLAAATNAVVNGSLSIGGFVLANIYMLQMVRPLETLGTALRDVSQAVGFVRPLLDVLGEPPEALPGNSSSVDRRSTALLPAAVSIRAVSFAYHPGLDVLDGLCLDIPAGRTVAVVGATGAGKSSLVRLLLRLYEPQRGVIELDGIPIADLPIDRLRSAIGLVPQDTILFNDTIANNIRVGRPDASRADLEHAARLARLHDFILSLPLGYDTQVGERGLKLSGGERQRVAIARAVIKRPRLYVFDEATSSLDGRTEAEILRNLREVSAGTTTLVIAHRLSTILHADEIFVLANGHVAESGTHAELLGRGAAYARLWEAQAPRRAA